MSSVKGSPCEFPECSHEVASVGLCSGHYAQKRRGKDLTPIKPSKRTLVDITGLKVEELTVLSLKEYTFHGSRVWLCQCNCGNTVEVTGSQLLRQDGKHTKSCGCSKNKRNKDHPRWTGHGDISGATWSAYKASARGRNYVFQLSIEDAWELFLKQDRKCALSGLPISFEVRHRSASLDRIDSSVGYVLSNVHWVHKDVNYMKSTHTLKYFLELCAQITMKNQAELDKQLDADV